MQRQGSLFDTGENEERAVEASHIIRVVFDAAVDSCFDYLVPDSLWPIGLGQRVLVPFGRGNKPVKAFCVGSDLSEEEVFKGGKKFKLKAVSEVIDEKPLLDEKQLELGRWISDYYATPLGQVISSMVPAAVKKGVGASTQKYVYLAFVEEEFEEKVKTLRKGSKQRLVAELLNNHKAYESETAMEQSLIADEAGTSNSVVKKLFEKGFAKFESRTYLKSLPAVPEGLTLKPNEVVLNDDHQRAVDFINGELTKEQFGVSLLYGVTDSGKTEVYIRAIQRAVELGKAAIILLPEIALTAQTVQRFSSRFDRLAVMHSGLTAAQRNVQWQKIATGQADVIIGARSAIFAPVKNLGLIVVDEEHEPSYKQDVAPRYQGRDVAIKRAHLEKAHCLLGSATPSLETLLNCKTKEHFTLLPLPKRVMDLPMPAMECVDLTYEPGGPLERLISTKLEGYVKKCLENKEQVILLLNRRGYSNFVFCPSCKFTLHCRNCDVSLTFHKSKKLNRTTGNGDFAGKYNSRGYAVCHYCGSQTLVPDRCPLCEKKLIMIGLGAQRLEEELSKRFPDARVNRIDSDSMQAKDYYQVLQDFSQGKVDILAGTQMLAKGLHFPNVTLVGVISADTSLAIPDFRANERTFQLLSQVAGRTGRGQKPGKVVIQTVMPEQPAIKFALAHDFDGFSDAELSVREKCSLPPFWRMAILKLRDENFEKLQAAANEFDKQVGSVIESLKLNIRTRGPMPSPIARLHRNHRMQIVLQSSSVSDIQIFFRRLRQMPTVKPVVKISYDVDPINLL